jgi:hypothetical protein
MSQLVPRYTVVSTPRPAATTEASRGWKDYGADKYDKHDKECVGGNLEEGGVWTSPCDGKKDECCPGFTCKLDQPIFISQGSKYDGIIVSNEFAPYTEIAGTNTFSNGNFGSCCVGEFNYDITHLICEPGQVSIIDGTCLKRNLILKPKQNKQRNQLACMCCGGSVLLVNLNGNHWSAFCNNVAGGSDEFTGVCPN